MKPPRPKPEPPVHDAVDYEFRRIYDKWPAFLEREQYLKNRPTTKYLTYEDRRTISRSSERWDWKKVQEIEKRADAKKLRAQQIRQEIEDANNLTIE